MKIDEWAQKHHGALCCELVNPLFLKWSLRDNFVFFLKYRVKLQWLLLTSLEDNLSIFQGCDDQYILKGIFHSKNVVLVILSSKKPEQILISLIQYLDIWCKFYQALQAQSISPYTPIITSDSILTMIDSLKTPIIFFWWLILHP